MDAATLYMIATLANGVSFTVVEVPFPTNRECQQSAEYMDFGRMATAHRRKGASVVTYCAPPRGHMVIAR